MMHERSTAAPTGPQGGWQDDGAGAAASLAVPPAGGGRGAQRQVGEAVGGRFRRLRLALKLNQTDFAARIGVSQSCLSDLEQGRSVPTRPVLLAVACTFAARLDWLTRGDGPMLGTILPRVLLQQIPGEEPATVSVTLPGMISGPNVRALTYRGADVAGVASDGDLVIFEPGDFLDPGTRVVCCDRFGQGALGMCGKTEQGEYVVLAGGEPVPLNSPQPQLRVLGRLLQVVRTRTFAGTPGETMAAGGTAVAFACQ